METKQHYQRLFDANDLVVYDTGVCIRFGYSPKAKLYFCYEPHVDILYTYENIEDMLNGGPLYDCGIDCQDCICIEIRCIRTGLPPICEDEFHNLIRQTCETLL